MILVLRLSPSSYPVPFIIVLANRSGLNNPILVYYSFFFHLKEGIFIHYYQPNQLIMKNKLLFYGLMIFSLGAFAQDRQITGTVTDQDGGGSLPGVNVRVKGTSLGTASDSDGKFSISVPQSATSLVFSFIGFAEQEVAVGSNNVINVAMAASASELGEIVVAVGRGVQRTITDTPLPIDVLSAKDLTTTGQLTFDKALQYRVPSFNTVQTPVNDATSLLDPYELRNMGPSRTLILINGKRKNSSALIYTQTSPGRGETGADISAIPTSAIKRVEILRDGASAQYGSDAIAGVMNVILKDRYEYSTLNLTTGITTKGDGENYAVSLNSGANVGERGYVNYTCAVFGSYKVAKNYAEGLIPALSRGVGGATHGLLPSLDRRGLHTKRQKLLIAQAFQFRAFECLNYLKRNVLVARLIVLKTEVSIFITEISPQPIFC